MITKVDVTYEDGSTATFTGSPVDLASIPGVSSAVQDAERDIDETEVPEGEVPSEAEVESGTADDEQSAPVESDESVNDAGTEPADTEAAG